jgi:hypothetical protein
MWLVSANEKCVNSNTYKPGGSAPGTYFFRSRKEAPDSKYLSSFFSQMSKRVLAKAVQRMVGQAVKKTKPNPRPRRQPRKRKATQMLQLGPEALPPPGMSSVTAPVSIGYNYDTRPRPIRRTLADGGESIAFTELVIPSINFPTGTGFGITSEVYLNPGLPETFSWLSPIAARFKQYRVAKMRLVYVPIAPTNTQGNIVVYPAYDATETAPTTENAMVNNQDAFERVVWNGFYVDLDVRAMNSPGPRKFTRQGFTSGDLKTMDPCRLFVGGNNAVSNSGAAMGKLFIEYEFVFYVPSSNPVTGPTGTYYAWNLAADSLTTTLPASLNFTTLYDPFNIGPTTTVAGNTYVYTLPPGAWLITANFPFADSANEVFVVKLEIWQGFATLGGPGRATSQTIAGPAVVTLTATALLEVLPTGNSQYMQVVATATGAAGALSCAAGGSLSICPA